MRRVLSSLLLLVVLTFTMAGAATAVNPGPIQFPLVAAVQATVKDQCTGRNVAGVVSSVSESTGASIAPSKTTASGFTFQNLPPDPALELHVAAPGYLPLGDPAGPDPGVTVSADPGPIDRVTKDPGPAQLAGETRAYQGSTWAITLMPQTGCAGPRQPKPATFSAKLLDLATGAPIPSGTVQLIPDPGTPTAASPGPIQFTNGAVGPVALACGAYQLAVDAPGYNTPSADAVGFVQAGQPCDSAIASGTATISRIAELAIPPLVFNHPPVIDWVTSDALDISGTNDPSVGYEVSAHDPDPGETALLAYVWTVTPSSGVSCNSHSSGASGSTGPCAGNGTVSINVTVTDPHGASAATGFVLLVTP